MQATETPFRAGFGPLDRVAIIAGSGLLPREVADGVTRAGSAPFVVAVKGETDIDWNLDGVDHQVLAIEEYGRLVPLLRKAGATHLVMAGGISRRPKLSAIRWNVELLKMLPSIVAGLARGDDGLLRMLVRHLEAQGFRVLGAHEIVPDLLAPEAKLSRAAPTAADWRDIEAAFVAARAIGALDIGQAAVAMGGRAIALEGIEGTDGLLQRVRDLRSNGRIAGARRGVLVKCAKPGQELRADLPTIGPGTVDAAREAGLAGIAVEARRAIVLQQADVIARADALGLFVVGVSEGKRP